MWEMAKSSIILFIQGRLFKDFGSVARQALIGIIITAATLVLLHQLTDLPLWGYAAVAGFIGGFLQPYLFKDLKYA